MTKLLTIQLEIRQKSFESLTLELPIMNKNLSSLHARIRSILLTEWDPIGVQFFLEAQDEYDSYVDPICDLINANIAEIDLFNYLWFIETEYMGLPGEREHTEKITKTLLMAKD